MPSLAPFGQAVSEEKIFLTLANQKKELILATMISVILIVVCFILLTKNSVLFLNHKHTKIMLNNNLPFKKKKVECTGQLYMYIVIRYCFIVYSRVRHIPVRLQMEGCTIA
jgi:ABC-type Fe3+ transport system permease subunit